MKYQMVGSMELRIGQCSDPLFEFINKEWERVSEDKCINEKERDERLAELAELHSISQPNRHPDTIPYFVERYVARLKSSRNYYSQRPLHWTSFTVK